MFRGFFDVRRPGGVLGVVEHRAKGDVADDDKSGYVGEQQVIAMAEAAGFTLDAKSEVNANPKDTKDHPNGVWTLPPGNNHDDADDAKYQAIGESDRMRSEEHTSELQSLMRISYAVFCLKQKITKAPCTIIYNSTLL